MLHCCLNCPFWLHENQVKCCWNLQLNGLFLGSWKIWFHRLEPKPNRINQNKNSSVPYFQSNRSIPSSQITELAEGPKNRIDRFRLTEQPDWPAAPAAPHSLDSSSRSVSSSTQYINTFSSFLPSFRPSLSHGHGARRPTELLRNFSCAYIHHVIHHGCLQRYAAWLPAASTTSSYIFRRWPTLTTSNHMQTHPCLCSQLIHANAMGSKLISMLSVINFVFYQTVFVQTLI